MNTNWLRKVFIEFNMSMPTIKPTRWGVNESGDARVKVACVDAAVELPISPTAGGKVVLQAVDSGIVFSALGGLTAAVECTLAPKLQS